MNDPARLDRIVPVRIPPSAAAHPPRGNRTGEPTNMILSEREQRVLAETARQLAATDPRFARAMRRGTPSATVWTRTGCAAVTVLACLSALLCVALSLIGPGIV